MDEHQKNGQNAESRPLGARLLFTTALILIFSTCFGLVGGGAAFWGERTGVFQRWQALGTPPIKAVEFITGDMDVIYVSTITGDIYGCSHENTADSSCWYSAQEPLWIDPEIQFDTPLFQGALKPPRGTVVDELDTTLWYADAAFETRYILLEDGSVWMWDYDKGLGSLLVCLLGPLAGMTSGITISTILWAYIGLRKLRG